MANKKLSLCFGSSAAPIWEQLKFQGVEIDGPIGAAFEAQSASISHLLAADLLTRHQGRLIRGRLFLKIKAHLSEARRKKK